MLTRPTLVLLSLLVVVACSSEAAEPMAVEPTVVPSSTAETVVATTIPSPPTTVGQTTTTSTVPAVEPEEYFPGAELAEITASTVGDGARPRLEWEPVPDAVDYMLLVLDPEGEPWWSWTGSETGVVLGGVEGEHELGGPAAVDGASWVVFALGDDGSIFGASPVLTFGR